MLDTTTERSGNVQCPQMPESGIYGSSGSPFFHWTHWTSVGVGYLNEYGLDKIMSGDTCIEVMQTMAKSKRGLCLSRAFLGNYEKLLWQCERGHTWRTTPHLIKKGRWCKSCSKLGKNNSFFGKKHSEETKRKISETLKETSPWKGRKHTGNTKAKMRIAALGEQNAFYGKNHSDETKNKMSLSRDGKKLKLSCDEIVKRTERLTPYIGLSGKDHPAYGIHLFGEKNHFYGKKHSEETRKILSESRKGWKMPEWHKEVMRQHMLKRIFPKKDTKIEMLMQEELRKKNIQFKTHIPITGRPDIFIEPNICIFCDGDYWHTLPKQINRDVYVNETLSGQGYLVLRFWEKDINRDVSKCVGEILNNIGG